MAFASIVRALQRSPLTEEFLGRLDRDRQLIFSGAAQLPKAFTISALAQARGRSHPGQTSIVIQNGVFGIRHRLGRSKNR